MSMTMRSGLGRVLELEDEARRLEDKIRHQRIELAGLNDRVRTQQEYVMQLDRWVATYSDMLPGDKHPKTTEGILKAFGEKAVADIGTLMAACIDYRNVLIRANIGDPVSGRHQGVEAIMRRYGVKVETKRTAGVDYLNAYISNVT